MGAASPTHSTLFRGMSASAAEVPEAAGLIRRIGPVACCFARAIF